MSYCIVYIYLSLRVSGGTERPETMIETVTVCNGGTFLYGLLQAKVALFKEYYVIDQ